MNANGVYNSNPAGTIYGDPLANSTNANFNYDAGTLVNGINTKQTSLTTTGANAGTRFIKDTVLSWETAAATYASTDSSVDYSKWFVIYGGGIDGANTSVQELLVYNFTPVGVPEPGSMVLLGSAMLACAALIRRARKN